MTTQLRKVVPEAFTVSEPRHHCSSKISENYAFPRVTQSVKGLFGAANSATHAGRHRGTTVCIGLVELDGVLEV